MGGTKRTGSFDKGKEKGGNPMDLTVIVFFMGSVLVILAGLDYIQPVLGGPASTEESLHKTARLLAVGFGMIVGAFVVAFLI